jgi:pimeloyl-ACP methyl ester carboxylesterase
MGMSSCHYESAWFPSRDHAPAPDLECTHPHLPRTVLTNHRYPQTSYSFRKVIEPLAAKGYYVVAPDYRGAGQSTATQDGYDKWTMAGDLHTLYTKVLGKKSAVIVGMDIGSMVATALALRFREDVDALFASGRCGVCGMSTAWSV